MQYEIFCRHLHEKYPTKVHLVDQLIDQLKIPLKSSDSIYQKNLLQAHREISYPLISYLNQIETSPSMTMKKEIRSGDLYLNECLLMAQRGKYHRYADRDRKICYENFLLAEKLQSMKKSSPPSRKIPPKLNRNPSQSAIASLVFFWFNSVTSCRDTILFDNIVR